MISRGVHRIKAPPFDGALWGRRTGVQERVATSPLGFDSHRLHTIQSGNQDLPGHRLPVALIERRWNGT